jgi:hypothetical protein
MVFFTQKLMLMRVKIIAAVFLIVVSSCTNPRTIYISNTTDKSVTLLVEKYALADTVSQWTAFKDSLHGKQIKPGHIKIDFGKGKWNSDDQSNLESMLPRIIVLQNGNSQPFKLPKDTRIKHYGWIANELVLRIDDLKE